MLAGIFYMPGCLWHPLLTPTFKFTTMASTFSNQLTTKVMKRKSKRKQKFETKTESKDEVSALHDKARANADAILENCRSVAHMMQPVEEKEVIPPFRGRDAPCSLTSMHLGYRLSHSKDSLVLQNTLRGLFGDKVYAFRISTALNMSSSGAGIVNSTISNSVLVSNADFVSLTAVFNEFFVTKFIVKWRPVSRYQYPLGGTSTLSVANLPMGKADLQHGAAAYTNLSDMSQNFRFGYYSTGDPFSSKWVNTQKPTDEIVASLTAPTQSWCTVNNASNYQGTLQFLTQSSPPALPFSQVLGTFIASFDILFRIRT